MRGFEPSLWGVRFIAALFFFSGRWPPGREAPGIWRGRRGERLGGAPDEPHGLEAEQEPPVGLRALLEAERLARVGIPKDQPMDGATRRLWEWRYGDGERIALLGPDQPEWR